MSKNKVIKAQPLDPNAQWLTVEEAGYYIRYSPSKMLDLIYKKILPATKLGGAGTYRIKKTDIDEMMERWANEEVLMPKKEEQG